MSTRIDAKREPGIRANFRLRPRTRELLDQLTAALKAQGPLEYTMTDVVEMALHDLAKKILKKS